MDMCQPCALAGHDLSILHCQTWDLGLLNDQSSYSECWWLGENTSYRDVPDDGLQRENNFDLEYVCTLLSTTKRKKGV